ncbi:hypothetical protein C0989_005568 [Termitomyces sp. Mn162]|nr:hypothetical protein C0989_005568 [Termitomyces sp. Mn162]
MANDIGEVTKSGRTLIVCFDGTSNEYNGVETNVIKLFSLLKKDDFNQQICYYQPGIGTWFNPGVVSPFVRWGAQVLDLAFAWCLRALLVQLPSCIDRVSQLGTKSVYLVFLEARTPHGTKIHTFENIVAYSPESILRALAGFLHKVSTTPLIADKLASVGMLASRTLPFTNSNKAIKTFRHALSLDEHRAKFKPNYYHHPTRKAPVPAKHDSAENTPNLDSFKSTNSLIQKLKRGSNRIKKFYKREIETIFAEETQPEEEGIPDTDVLEVWFSGCHADVGGGTVPDKETHSLANISLRWMVREIQQARCGIIFDEKALQRLEIPRVVFEVDSVTKVEVPTVREQEAEREDNLNAIDALQPMYDQLKVGNKLWWLLELMPLTYMWQDQDKEWHSKLSMNLGRGRKIKDANPNFHETVKLRMDDTRLKYKPKAIWTAGSENYVH